MSKKKRVLPEGVADIVSTLRLEIVKPLDGDWSAIGPALRALRAPLHRVLNGVITDLEIEERAGKFGKADDGKVPAQSRSYQLVRTLWQHEREVAAARVAARKQNPKATVYPGDEQIALVQPSGMVILGTAGAVYARWKKWGKEKWKGTMSLPTFKGGSPIYIASSNKSVQLTPSDGLAVLTLPLFGAGDDSRETRASFIVRPYGGSGFASLRQILADPSCIGDCRLVEEDDRDGKRKWMAFVSFHTLVREVPKGRTMALHRGVRTFLTAAIARSDDGKEAYTAVLADGGDVLAHKAGYDARRRSLGKHRAELGAGARGHGKARREEHITRLEDAEARWVRTKCQEIASHAMRLAEKRGVSRILVEDWTNPAKDGAPELGQFVECLVRRFPLAQLRESIEWAAKKRGFAVEVVATDGNTSDCPNCRHAHTPEQSHAFGKSGVFRCEECKLERPVDMIFPWNMLVRDGQPSPLPDQIAATKRAVAKLKSAAVKASKGQKPAQPQAEPAE